MNKYRLLLLIIVGLLITNGALLFKFIKGSNKHLGPKDIIIEKLHFDSEQIRDYETIIEKHRKDVRENEEIMNDLRSELYQQLTKKQDSSIVNSLISKIAYQQTEAEKINYNHFLEIKKLCKPSQQKDFDELTEEITQLFSKKEKR